MDQMAFSDLFIQLPFTMCQALWQALGTDRTWMWCLSWRDSQTGGGEMDGSADYLQSSMVRVLDTRTRIQELKKLTPNSGIQSLNTRLQRNKYLKNERSYS